MDQLFFWHTTHSLYTLEYTKTFSSTATNLKAERVTFEEMYSHVME